MSNYQMFSEGSNDQAHKDKDHVFKGQQGISNWKDKQEWKEQISKDEDILYRPPLSKPLPSIAEMSSSRSAFYSQRKKDPLDYAEEEEKGTFYRQFTDTRILNMLPEPQRSTVKMLKNRFIGVHHHRHAINKF